MNRRDRRALKYGHDPRNVYHPLRKGSRALPDQADVEAAEEEEQPKEKP